MTVIWSGTVLDVDNCLLKCQPRCHLHATPYSMAKHTERPERRPSIENLCRQQLCLSIDRVDKLSSWPCGPQLTNTFILISTVKISFSFIKNTSCQKHWSFWIQCVDRTEYKQLMASSVVSLQRWEEFSWVYSSGADGWVTDMLLLQTGMWAAKKIKNM